MLYFRKKPLTSSSVSAASSESSDEERDRADATKVVTKGALKVFEGLKVSIPTEDIDLTQVLNKKVTLENGKLQELNELKEEKKSLPVKTQINDTKTMSESFKTQPKPVSEVETLKEPNKNYDVYDFEETQDNSDVFFANPLSNYRNFRHKFDMQDKPLTPGRELETSNTFSFEAVSISSNSTISNISAKKQKVGKNMTKKKCMIMGRIFKNALKSKVGDEIREIPEVSNEKFVNDYVLSCPHPDDSPKATMTQEEMDRLFNNLLEGKTTEDCHRNNNVEIKITNSEPVKTLPNKHKVHTQKTAKPKKRTRNNSESTDDEFSLGKPAKKRTYKKSEKRLDNSINLEQELKECIGVASRKSQRKCTSGKQNVLVEFWSSDESASEAVLEVKPISSVDDMPKHEEVKKAIVEEVTTPIVAALAEKPPEKEEEKLKPTLEPPLSKIQKKHKKPPAPQRRKSKSKPKELEKLKITTEPIAETLASSRRKRTSVNTLYYWSSSSEDEYQDLIEVKSIREEFNDDEDRPMQHGWIVGDSPKKLVTMLAQAKGKKSDLDSVKEQAKNRTSVMCS